MQTVELLEIKKLKWKCINPHCLRGNEEDYPLSKHVVCFKCGTMYSTTSPNPPLHADKQGRLAEVVDR